MQNDQIVTAEQRHQIWMKNASFLYDRLLVHKLKWPSFTFQWLPYQDSTSTSTSYRFIFGTHCSGAAQTQHLYIAQITFPHLRTIHEQFLPNPTPVKLKNIFRFTHGIQINKARYCQSDPSFIAGKIDDGPIAIFKAGTEYSFSLLEGELGKGFALEWRKQGLLTGDCNGNIYIWRDIQRSKEAIKHWENIDDVRWVSHDVIASVGEAGIMNFWDLRSGGIVESVVVQGQDNKKQLYSVCPNWQQPYLVLSGGEDGGIRLWDRRNLKTRLHKFADHSDSVLNLSWSKLNPTVFVSGSADSKTKIWDLMRVGFEIPKDQGGTDELLFTHEGHRSGINDVAWNDYEMLLGSVEENPNVLELYQIANTLHDLEYQQDVQYLRAQCFQ